MKIDKVLLAGATGYLGKYIAHELLEKEYNVKLLVRNLNKVSFDPKKFELIQAEVTRPETLEGITGNIDIVISTIGITKQKDGYTYMDVDYQANLNLLEEAKRSGVRKFIYVSALNGDKLKYLKMVKAKEMFVEQLKNSGLDYCIVRPNGFFSDMTEFLKMAKKGTVHFFGNGDYKINPIHGEDLARVCVNAIYKLEKTIEIGGPEIFTHKDIARMAFQILDKKPKFKYMPDGIRKLILWFTRAFTSSKTYGPIEFFMTVLAMDMIAPTYGNYKLKTFFEEERQNI